MIIPFPKQEFSDGLYPHQRNFLNIFDSDNGIRYYMLRWARRHRKTSTCLNLLIRECLKFPKTRNIYIAPLFTQARNICFKDPDMLTRWLPEQKIGGQELYTINKSELTITFFNGSVLQFMGADNPNKLRGINFRLCVVDEYAEHKSDEVLKSIIVPIMGSVHNKDSRCVLIFTPRGVNHAIELWDSKETENNPDWWLNMVKASETDIVTEEQLQKDLQLMGRNLWLQEYEVSALADSELTIINNEILEQCKSIFVHVPGSRQCVSIDLGFGGDKTVCYHLVNNEIKKKKIINQKDSNAIAGLITIFTNECKCPNIVIDADGIGRGVADMLNANPAFNVIYFKSTEKSLNKKYLNRKAYAWFKVKEMMSSGLVPFPEEAELRAQLRAVDFGYNYQTGRIKVAPKSEVRVKLGRSPDDADAYIYGIQAYDKLPDELRNRRIELRERKLRSNINTSVGNDYWSG